MKNEFKELYNTVLSRRESAESNSYTAYLFEQGIDKVLKKVGEETSEVIIAAKNDNNHEVVAEIVDLIYHLNVLMVIKDISLDEICLEIDNRAKKAGNLKNFHDTDKNS